MTYTFRPPAVAGQFYPADPASLRNQIEGFLANAKASVPPPKAIVVPHAGYIYSGAVAASAYACILPLYKRIHRVVLLGPCHRVPLRGLALPSVDYFATPLGMVEIDKEAAQSVTSLPHVVISDRPHGPEHSLEVHLPFLQLCLERFKLIPLAVGESPPEEIATVLEHLWGGEETLIVISTDLSHFHEYQTARRLDQATSRSIEEKRYQAIGPEDACGCRPLNGLLYLARQRELEVIRLDLRNSGDTAGPRNSVVGYGSYAIH